jgi:hypothetical protein
MPRADTVRPIVRVAIVLPVILMKLRLFIPVTFQFDSSEPRGFEWFLFRTSVTRLDKRY